MTIPLIIGKELVLKDAKESTYEVINPSNEQIVDKVSLASEKDVEQAVGEARKALTTFSQLALSERVNLLLKAASEIRKHIDELSVIMSSEVGRPIKSSRFEIERTAYTFELTAGYAGKALEGRNIRLDQFIWPGGNRSRIGLTVREPIGVVLAITPFNFPPASVAQKIAPSLAVGNTVVVKPSLSAPLTIFRLLKILLESGFPPGTINYLTGQSSKIGRLLTDHKGIQGISFTGSSKVGLEIASRAAGNGKRFVMELGSSDPFIVLDDANVEQAAKFAAFARFDYAGQYCNAGKRFFVSKSIYDQFNAAFVEATKRMIVGDPLDEKTDIGPLINKSAVESFISVVADAKQRGGRILLGGGKLKGKGFFVEPTIAVDVSNQALCMKEETFYPIAPVVPFNSTEEVTERANEMEYGLDASIFTTNFGRGYKLAQAIDAGTVMINDHTRLRWDGAPFGGSKKSGFGKESVWDSMLELSKEKFIVTNVENYS